MADNSTQIKTRFVLEGVSKALGELRAFTQGVRAAAVEAAKQSQSAKGGFEGIGKAGAKSGAEVLTTFKVLGREIQVTGRSAVAMGTAMSAAGKTINTAFSAVLAILRAVRAAAAATFGGIVSGAVAAANAIKGVFGALHGEVQGIAAKFLKSQIGTLTGGGVALKFTLSPTVSGGILEGIRGIAQRAGALFSSVFSNALRLLNPFSRGLQRVVRGIRRSALFAASPTLAIGAGVNSGANDVQQQVDTNSELAQGGFDIKSQSQYQSFFEQVGGKAEDATSVLRRFIDASKDIAEKGAESPFAQSLAAAGIAFEDLNGQARSGVAIFNDLVEAYQKGTLDPNQYHAVAEAMRQIAGSGKEALPFFRFLDQTSGSEGDQRLRDMAAAAEKFGTVIGPAQISAMTAYKSGLGALRQAFEGLKISLLTNIGPTLGTFFSGIGDLLARNRDALTLFARGVIDSAILMATEIGIVVTQSREQFSGYNFRFPWLVTLKNGVLGLVDTFKAFFGFISGAAPLTFAVFDKLTGQVKPIGATIGEALGRGVVWIRNFVASLAELYAYGTTEPGFEWLGKVVSAFRIAWEWGGFLVEQLIKINKAIKEGANGQFGGWIKDKLAEAVDYAIALGKAIYSFTKTGSAGSGFEWIDTVAAKFQAVRAMVTQAYADVTTFFKALAGNQDALEASPLADKIREQVLAYLPVLKDLAAGVGQFVSGLLPPLLQTINGMLSTLRPYLAELQAYLQKTGDYAIGLVKTVAQYFDGVKFDKVGDQFKWVYSVLDGVKALGQELAGIVRVAAAAIADPKLQLAGDDKQFAWVQRVIETFRALRDIVLTVGNILSGITGGLLNPAEAALLLFFGTKIPGMLAAAMKGLTAFAAGVALLFGNLPGTIARALAGSIPLVAAAVGLFTTGTLGGGLAEGIAAAITAAVVAAFGSSKFRAAVKAAFPTVAELAAGSAGATAVKSGGKALASSETAAVAAGSAGAVKAAASAAGTVAKGAVAATPSAAGAAVVESGVAASGLAAALRGGAGMLVRFAGVVGTIITALEVANLVADITGAKQKFMELLHGEDDSKLTPEQRLAKARRTGGSYAAPIGEGKKFDTLGYGDGGDNPDTAQPTPFNIAAMLGKYGLRWEDYNDYGAAMLALNKARGINGFTDAQSATGATTGDGFLQQLYSRRLSAGDVAQMTGPDGSYSAAGVRNQLADSANQVAPLVDSLSAALGKNPTPIDLRTDGGTVRAVVSGDAAALLAAIDAKRRQRAQAGFAPDDVVPYSQQPAGAF